MNNNITDTMRTFWRRVPRAIRSGWITAWVTFTGSLLSILTGLLPQLANAITTKNFEPFYNSLSFGFAAGISAALAFFAGVVNSFYRWLSPIAQAYQMPPGEAPDEDFDDAGFAN
ncbi:MAG: hypothetical protein LC687_01655, partial [Actinobacteria bacterium]|nr:hypothetical protein [Actinomycetota bacterium]